jgi:predicted metalloprotease with PDZ domain
MKSFKKCFTSHCLREANLRSLVSPARRMVLWPQLHTIRLCVSIAVFLMVLAAPASATIRYTISLDHPEQHVFHVRMEIPNISDGADVAIPAWNALYQIRDFAQRITDVRASVETPLSLSATIHALDKQTWRVEVRPSNGSAASSTEVVVDYSAEWDESGPFNSQLNEHHAFVNFAEILMYVPSRRDENTEVEFDNVPADWRIASELPVGRTPNSFAAPSYDALVDAPTEAGKFEEFTFEIEGVHFRVVVDGPEWNKNHLENFLRHITDYELRLMNGSPFKQYTFFFHINPNADLGGGGMEHSYSTAIAASSTESAASIAAHEFFHAWNVKRIRPQALEPVDYAREQYTRALWFAEGVTSTYAAFTLERSGLWSKEQFYMDLARQIGALESRPARKWQSVEESSVDTWLEKYDGYSRPDRSISYYNKGQILGVLLDLSIRDATDSRRSLDDVLRRMNMQFAQRGLFYNESGDIRKVAEEISGVSFDDFFQRYVAGTGDIPYEEFLSVAGLELKVAATRSVGLGFVPVLSGAEVKVSALQPGSAADLAGMRNGDIILAVNERSDAKNFPALLRGLSPGDTVSLRTSRGGAETEVSLPVGSREDQRYSIVEMPHPTEKQRRIRDGFLHGTTN